MVAHWLTCWIAAQKVVSLAPSTAKLPLQGSWARPSTAQSYKWVRCKSLRIKASSKWHKCTVHVFVIICNGQFSPFPPVQTRLGLVLVWRWFTLETFKSYHFHRHTSHRKTQRETDFLTHEDTIIWFLIIGPSTTIMVYVVSFSASSLD